MDIPGAQLGGIFLSGDQSRDPVAADRAVVAIVQAVQAADQAVKIGTVAGQAVVSISAGGSRYLADQVVDGEHRVEKGQEPEGQERHGVRQPPPQGRQAQGRPGNQGKGNQYAQHRGAGAIDHQGSGQNRQHQEHSDVVGPGQATRGKGAVVKDGGKGQGDSGGQLVAERGGVGGQAGGAAVGQDSFQVNFPHRGELQPEG